MRLSRLWTADWWRPDYLRYVLGPCREYYSTSLIVSWFMAVLCRATGHGPVVWFNPSGMEPDYTCQRCGDDLE